MSMSDNSSRYKRTNLFLIRVLCDNPDESDPVGKSERPAPVWRGTVQRAVSGEAHSFEAKGELLEVLDSMICKDRPEHSRPRGNPGSKDGVSASGNNGNNGNNQTEADEVHESTQ